MGDICFRAMTSTRCSAVAAALLASAALAACGSSGNDSSSSGSNAKAPSGAKDSKVAALVPAAVKKKGTLSVAADATYPPNEFLKPGSKTVIGMDADLADALGKVMGVKVKVLNANFDSIIPGLAAHKYDVGM